MLNKRNKMCKIPYSSEDSYPSEDFRLQINNPYYLDITKCLLFPNSSVIINLKSDLEYKKARDLLIQALSDFNMWKFATKLSQNICIDYNIIDYNIKSYDTKSAEISVETMEVQFKNGSKIKIINNLNRLTNDLNL